MTFKSTPLNSITPVETPTIVGDRFIDGYLDGQPVIIHRLSNGMYKCAIGTVLSLSYGIGEVVGYLDNRLHVKVTDFESDEAKAKVARISMTRNIGIEQDRRRFVELYKSDITDKLSKTNDEKMEDLYPLFGTNEVVVNLSNYPLSEEIVHVTVIPTEKERKAQAENRRAMEVAEALRLRRELLEKYADDTVPDEVSADIADTFGE